MFLQLTEQSGKHQLSYISFLKEFHESKQIDNHIFSNITAGSVTIFKGSRLNSCGESHIGKYDLVCSAAFPSSTIKFDPEEEKIASIANYHYEDEMVNRASATGSVQSMNLF